MEEKWLKNKLMFPNKACDTWREDERGGGRLICVVREHMGCANVKWATWTLGTENTSPSIFNTACVFILEML